MKDEPLKICPKCGKAIRRLINGGNGVIFKGGGFYVTDKNTGSAKSARSGKSGDAPKAAPEKTAAAETAPCAGCAKSESCPKAAS